MPTISSGQLPPGAGTSMRSPIASFRRRANCSLTRRYRRDAAWSRHSAPTSSSGQLLAIGRVIGQAQHLDRRAGQLRVGAAAGQDRLDLGAVAQPVPDLGRLRIVGGADIDVRRQPSVEPDQKGAAETFDHGADADIDRERQQQRHQRQRQSRQLLAAVGPEPGAKRPSRMALAERQHDLQQHRQDQRRAEQQWRRARQSPRSGNRRTAESSRRRRTRRAPARSGTVSQRCCACCQA